jgi:hypothetical protein
MRNRLRRLVPRTAGLALAALSLGAAVLSSTPMSAAAATCGPIRDPNTGQIIGYVLCPLPEARIKIPECRCPDSVVQIDPATVGDPYSPQQLAGQQLAAGH